MQVHPKMALCRVFPDFQVHKVIFQTPEIHDILWISLVELSFYRESDVKTH